MLAASDRPVPRDVLVRLAGERGSSDVPWDAGELAGAAAVLTDDDAPVDQLLTPYPSAA